MKSSKIYLIAVAVVFLLVANGWLLINHLSDIERKGAQQRIDDDDAEPEQAVLKIDGKGNSAVYLQSLDIQVEVTGNIASTRYTMVFKNKTDRVLEGELTFPLPDGRSVTFYALDINGRMREAVPVEKARATLVFEEIEQRRVDPGILERVEGNNFRTRVYPVPAHGTRTISIGYEEELPLEKNGLQYRLPLEYFDSLENFSVKATVWKSNFKPIVPDSVDEFRFDKTDENYVAAFARQNYHPAKALIFSLPTSADIPQIMMQSAQGSYYFLASVAPKFDSRKKQWNSDLAIIWDVSLSAKHRDLKSELEILKILFTEKKDAKVHLYFLNNKLKKVVSKNTDGGEYLVNDGNWDELKNALNAAVFDGGTDFSQIKLNEIAGNEILLFSDGMSTLSDVDFIKKTKVTRPIHCVVYSPKADYSAMKLISGKTRGKFINTNALSSKRLKDELLNETLQFLGTEYGKAVREVYPNIATPVNGNFSLAGISDTTETILTLLFGFGNSVEKRINVKLNAKNADSRGNVYKLWAQKKIAELDLNYENNRAELTELGRQFGIVTRNTSLIVLETVEDYVRYKIEPPTELQEEYQRMLKEKGDRLFADELNMLNAAAEAADSIKKWWNTDWTPKQPKYPMPEKDLAMLDDDADSLESTSLDDHTHTSTPDIFSEQAKMTGLTPDSIEKILGKIGDGAPSVHASAPKAIFKAVNGFYDFFTTYDGLGAFIDGGLDILFFILSFNTPTESGRFYEKLPFYEERTARLRRANGVEERVAKLVKAEEISATLERRREILDVNGEEIDDDGQRNGISPTITLKPIKTDNDYLNQLTGRVAEDYQLYLKLREDYINLPTFYFDMADWFYKNGDKKTALRILTSIADLELENASLYRLLGYRLKEYGEYALEKFVCQKVVQWRPMEPQSYRDYALALADNGEKQAALDSLYGLLTRLYSRVTLNNIYGIIEEVVITEINHLIAKNANLDKSKIDTSLIINMPVDIRVVINWNMNNTDIDLHIKDPNNEMCSYDNYETKLGGRISRDITTGYGPEQFLLKKAIRGKYRVYVDYFSDRHFILAGPSTIMAEIFTKYAGKAEQRRVVCLQLSNVNKKEAEDNDSTETGDGYIEVAEFNF